jgi:hypothetical protein
VIRSLLSVLRDTWKLVEQAPRKIG